MSVSDATPEYIAQSDLLQNTADLATGLKIACRILRQWGASSDQVERILNLPYSLCQEAMQEEIEKVSLTPEQLHRIALVIDMHASLRTLFMNPENVNGFMGMPNNNEPFAGSAPLDLVASGDISELIRVQKYLAGLVIH